MMKHKFPGHTIQKSILVHLTEHKYARFSDMRPPKTDSNLYSYHLKLLTKNGFVEKTDEGYTLTSGAFEYVETDNINQPKVITMLVIQNGYGGVLMSKNKRQPFIDRWAVPSGSVYRDDISSEQAARRAVRESIGDLNIDLRHAGDCYIRIRNEKDVKISTLAHVFYGTTDEELTKEDLHWIQPHKVDNLDTAPAIKQIIARTFFKDPFFFEEFETMLPIAQSST